MGASILCQLGGKNSFSNTQFPEFRFKKRFWIEALDSALLEQKSRTFAPAAAVVDADLGQCDDAKTRQRTAYTQEKGPTARLLLRGHDQ